MPLYAGLYVVSFMLILYAGLYMLVYATFACKHFMPWLYASLIVSAFGTAGVVDMLNVSALHRRRRGQLNVSAFGTAGVL